MTDPQRTGRLCSHPQSTHPDTITSFCGGVIAGCEGANISLAAVTLTMCVATAGQRLSGAGRTLRFNLRYNPPIQKNMASKIPRNMTSKNTQDPLNSKLQNPHPPSLHDTTEIPRPKPEKVSHAVGDSACDTGAGRKEESLSPVQFAPSCFH